MITGCGEGFLLDRRAAPPIINFGPEFVESDVLEIGSKTADLTREVLAEAKRTREKDEHYYKILTWVSYTLYAAGSLVGLLGSLYAGKESTAPG